MSHAPWHRRRHDGFDAQMLAISEQLMREFDSLPLVDIVRALNDARLTTIDWLGNADPSALHDLARWNLLELHPDMRTDMWSEAAAQSTE